MIVKNENLCLYLNKKQKLQETRQRERNKTYITKRIKSSMFTHNKKN